MREQEKTKEELIEELRALRDRLSALEAVSPCECAGNPANGKSICLSAIFDHAIDAMFIIDRDGMYVDVNPAGCAMFGYAREEILGSDIRLLLFPEDIGKAYTDGKGIMDEGSYFPNYRMRKKGGSEIWVGMTVKPMRIGGKDFLLGIKRDVTAERMTDLAVKVERDRAKKYLDMAGVMVVVIDAARKVLMINRKGCEVLGYDEAGIVGADWFGSFVPEREREGVRAAFRDILSGDGMQVEYYENNVVTGDGSERTIAWRNTVLRDERGTFYALLSSGEDITERVAAEEALLKAREDLEEKIETRTVELKRANEAFEAEIKDRQRAEEELRKITERLQEAQQIARIGNWEWDIVNNTLFWSDEIYRIFGLAPNRFGATYEAFLNSVHPDDRDFVVNSVNSALRNRVPYSIDHRITLPDGSVRTVHEHGRVDFSPDGTALRMAGTVQDVTEQRLAGDKLRESERKFRSLTENLPVGVSLTLEDGTITEANPALWRIFGCASKEEFLKHRIQDFYVDPVERQKVVEAIRERGMVKELEVRVKRKDGGGFTGALTSLAQERGGGGIQIVSIFQDITERKRTEAELLKAQKLESVGALAGGIAHDFNNLLLGILGNASIARNYLPEGDRVCALLAHIEKAANRAKNLTRQLLTFSKGGEPVKDVASIGALVRDSASLVLRDSDVVPEFRLPEDLWMVEMDEGQMSQVINNIVLNAAQATEGAGVIEVSAENITVRPGDGLSVEAGDYVRVTIEDHGSGIPELIINRIFDPFFTTKQKASGLGLAVSYSIVRKHGGFIQVESVSGRGSAFHVYLPAVRKDAITHAETVKTEAVRTAAKVLVMDDEELVRDVTGEMLEILGCASEFASDGLEAVRLYREAALAGTPYSAVILDLTIPGGTGGLETVKMLRDIDPGVKAIVSSGYSKDPIMSDFKKYGFTGVIAKPYSVSEFSRVVRGVLASEGRG